MILVTLLSVSVLTPSLITTPVAVCTVFARTLVKLLSAAFPWKLIKSWAVPVAAKVRDDVLAER